MHELQREFELLFKDGLTTFNIQYINNDEVIDKPDDNVVLVFSHSNSHDYASPLDILKAMNMGKTFSYAIYKEAQKEFNGMEVYLKSVSTMKNGNSRMDEIKKVMYNKYDLGSIFCRFGKRLEVTWLGERLRGEYLLPLRDYRVRPVAATNYGKATVE